MADYTDERKKHHARMMADEKHDDVNVDSAENTFKC